MTHVLSKLASASSGGKLSKIALTSSTAALLYWGYLLVVAKQRANTGAINNKGDKSREILFIDKKNNEKKKFDKKKVDLNETLRYLAIILKFASYKEIALSLGVSLGLILRSILDLYNIQISTFVESAIINQDINQLKYTLLSFLITVPSFAFVNNIIKYFTDKLSLSLRYNLSKALYDKYMTNLTFYHIAQCSEFENIDQLLTSDIDKFSTSIVEVYNNLSKPILDIVLLVHRMSVVAGIKTPAIMIGWLAFVGTILTQARKPLTGHIIRETQSEGQLRFVHSRLIQNSEEIAFFSCRGNKQEKHTLMDALLTLRDSLENSILFKFKIGMMDNIVGRYMSTVVGYLSIAAPFFSARYANKSNEERLTQYYVLGRMMMKLAESITRVILAGQDLTKLAAYTQRVKSLIDSMDNLYSDESVNNKFKAAMKRQQHSNEPTELNQEAEMEMIDGQMVEICDKNKRPSKTKASSSIQELLYKDGDLQLLGKVIEVEDYLRLQDVPVITPNYDILVPSLTLEVRNDMHLLITGPNGCGKSSLFRIMAGVWPIFKGQIERPSSREMFYVPQRPYMSLGTLRDQVIYPDSVEVMKEKGFCDKDLAKILDKVHLNQVVSREGGWSAIGDWKDILSGGEKQRMGMARVLYHKPKFALLDECTSAVSIDVESQIYQAVKDIGISLITITHRPSLWKFHTHLLILDGAGNFEFKRLVQQV